MADVRFGVSVEGGDEGIRVEEAGLSDAGWGWQALTSKVSRIVRKRRRCIRRRRRWL
jgi:hypothetical protein